MQNYAVLFQLCVHILIVLKCAINGAVYCVFDLGDYMKKLIIFGFDGTLADTSPGILYCFNTTATAMGYEPVDHSSLYGVIGIPLEQGFKKLFGMKEDEIEYAANNYSKLYSQKGKEMFLMYPGIENALKKLKKDGCKLAIATQKHRMFTSDMLEVYEIQNLFDAVCATDVNTNLTKKDLLLQACEQTGVSVEDSILIGDNDIEAVGAQSIGMDFGAALYGWGFRTKEEAEKYNCKLYFDSASEIYLKLSMM